MNSRYFMFLSAALLSVSLAACGDDENDPNPNPDPEPVVEENVSGNVYTSQSRKEKALLSKKESLWYSAPMV